MKYTIVQHSGVLTGHSEFTMGLESADVSSAKAELRVKQAGGLLFNDYGTAEDYAMEEQYPPSVTGYVPVAPGSFSTKVVGGRRIYIPVRDLVMVRRPGSGFAIHMLKEQRISTFKVWCGQTPTKERCRLVCQAEVDQSPYHPWVCDSCVLVAAEKRAPVDQDNGDYNSETEVLA